MTTTYLTVAIPYVNASPHLGYAYELVQALGGTDDYSLKNVLAAEAAGARTQDFVDEHATEFALLRKPLNVSFDDFIRTSSDPRHIPAVERLWRRLSVRGSSTSASRVRRRAPSAGLPLPTRIQVHPYLTVDGQKISKSAGTNAHPAETVAAFGTDTLRWFFAREVSETVDTDFTERRLVERANEHLANVLGNTTSRLTSLVHKYLGGRAPCEARVPNLKQEVFAQVREFRLREATRLIVAAGAQLNRDIEASAPWKLAGEPDALRALLARHLAAARELARAAEPIIPGLASELLARLGEPLCALPEITDPPFPRLGQ